MKRHISDLTIFLKWLLCASFIGGIGGLLGTVFHHSLSFVTGLREENNWLIFLLPLGGIITVYLYCVLRLKDNKGTNEIISCVLNKKAVKPLIAPAIYAAAVLTHLCGGSGGREGAALQLGGSIASTFAGIIRLKEKERSMLTVCGMASVFSGLFGTPLTACIFCLEFLAVGKVFSSGVFPCFVSSFFASLVSKAFGVHAETAVVSKIDLNFSNGWKIAVGAVAIALLGIIMCIVFKKLGVLMEKVFPNKFVRITVGAVIIVGATLIVGSQRYNGAGMDMALLAVSGKADWFDFILKLLFTAVTLAAGFKGGEIVPTFCIGATFGCILGVILGIDPGFMGAVGLVGLFCSATNAPLASVILSIEMFGADNIIIFALVCFICYGLSGKISLYSAQRYEDKKTA